MRFLILGASGMAGHQIGLYLQEQGHQVEGFCRRKVTFLPCLEGDVSDIALLEKTIRSGKYDVVINAVGILNKFAEDNPEVARYVNGELLHLLADILQDSRSRVIHMSTDCVFAGNTGPYTEDSVPDGATVYDSTKAAGELNDGKNITLRNSIVGPDVNENGIGLFNWFMKQEGPINGFVNAKWTGLTTLELSKAMECVAVEGATGLVNMVPEENISKYDLLQLFNKYFKDSRIQINPEESFVLDKTLVRTNFDCSFRPKPYDQQVYEMSVWVKSHCDLYPHYC